MAEAHRAGQAATDADTRATDARDELRAARAEHRDDLAALRADYAASTATNWPLNANAPTPPWPRSAPNTAAKPTPCKQP